jgi:hypothetical protein
MAIAYRKPPPPSRRDALERQRWTRQQMRTRTTPPRPPSRPAATSEPTGAAGVHDLADATAADHEPRSAGADADVQGVGGDPGRPRARTGEV